MAIPVEMPKMSDTMEEGVLVAWLVDEGTSVSAGDVIAQVETDKATMDLEVYDDGVLLKKAVEEGDSVPLGALIAVLGKEGEDVSSVLAKYEGGAPSGDGKAASESDAEPEPQVATPSEAPASTVEGGRIKASPLARKLAKEHGIDLASIDGSGPEGRIVKRDIEAAASDSDTDKPAAAPAPAPAPAADRPSSPRPQVTSSPTAPVGGTHETQKISQMRKAIARRLGESKYTAPHFYLTRDLDMQKAVAFRTQLNERAAAQDRGKVSYNDLVTKACALALRQHPMVNASWVEEQGEIHLHNDVHVAVAVAIDDGLITPVIRHADRKGLAQIAAETRELATRARDKQLQPDEFSGSTFTTSNLGMFGIEEFTAIINPPNVCILAIGAIRDVPVVQDGEIVPGKRMKVTLSCDHRVVDGASGAQFLATVAGYLEDPLTMLL